MTTDNIASSGWRRRLIYIGAIGLLLSGFGLAKAGEGWRQHSWRGAGHWCEMKAEKRAARWVEMRESVARHLKLNDPQKAELDRAFAGMQALLKDKDMQCPDRAEKNISLLDRLDKWEESIARQKEMVAAFRSSLLPFYESLNEDQQLKLDEWASKHRGWHG